MKNTFVIMFFLVANLLFAQEQTKKNYFQSKSEKEIEALSFTNSFDGKRVKDVIDTLGNDYIYIDLTCLGEYFAAVLVYEYDNNNYIIVTNALWQQSDYIDKENRIGYFNPKELIKEKIFDVQIRLTPKNRDKYEEKLERNLKFKAGLESEFFKFNSQFDDFPLKYDSTKKLSEQKYYILKNMFLLQNFQGLPIQKLLDIIGDNYYGYIIDTWLYELVGEVYSVDFRYKFKKETDICLTIFFKDRIKLKDVSLKKILEAETEKILVYLLPPTKLSYLIKNNRGLK